MDGLAYFRASCPCGEWVALLDGHDNVASVSVMCPTCGRLEVARADQPSHVH